MVVGLLGYVFVLFAVAGLEKGIQEAVADENSTEQAAVQEEVTQGEVPVQETAAQQTPAQDALAAGSGEVAYSPDYEIGLFSHKAHVNGAGLQCTACHTGIFQQAAGSAKSTGSFNMAAFGEGKYCGTCHNGSTAFTVQDEATVDAVTAAMSTLLIPSSLRNRSRQLFLTMPYIIRNLVLPVMSVT